MLINDDLDFINFIKMKHSSKHILVVDDNLKNLQLCASILKEEEYKISLAQSGSIALELIQKQVPNLILLDIMMPEIDGLEICRRIKAIEKFKHIPIIFLTAKSGTQNLVEGFNAGGVDYIVKPFNNQELLIRINTHLELADAREKIVEMNKTRDKLYSIIAHDIRSPLSVILSTIDALKNSTFEPDDELFKQLFTELEKKTNSTYNLLNNLLEWTNFQTEILTLKPDYNSINSIINDCLFLFNKIAADKNIQIETTLDDNVMAYFDEVTIYIVFRNLLSNAIKFTPENGKISISVSSGNENISISFKDTGKGMTSELIEKIFSRNEHYTSPGTNKERGTGLGLFLVKDFVKNNNGTIKVKSEAGMGTEFIINLPISK